MAWVDSESDEASTCPGRWSLDAANDPGIIRLLNREAHCLKKLVVSVWSPYLDSMTCEMREERLAQLEEVKEGVIFVAGNACALNFSPDEETRLMLEDYITKLNAKRA